MKIKKWDNPKKTLLERLNAAKASRQRQEAQWRYNERIVYKDRRITSDITGIDSIGEAFRLDAVDPDDSGTFSDISYTFRNMRLIHSQLATNPPAVNIRPATPDFEDELRADIADRVTKHAMREYKLKDRVDLLALSAILYGTGFIKHIWDPEAGDLLKWDAEEEEMILTGDISVRPVSPWKMLPDPDAILWDEVKWVFEELTMDFDEAVHRFPDKKEELKKARIGKGQNESVNKTDASVGSQMDQQKWNSVLLYQYWETGLPLNGRLGRYAIITEQGDLIDGVRDNPHAFTVAANKVQGLPKGMKLPKVACLPYTILTDIDVVNSVWGKSFIEYSGPSQDFLNEMDSIQLENARTHGIARGLLPAECQIDELTDSTMILEKIEGLKEPHFMAPPQPMPELVHVRTNHKTAIDDMAGINESMLGQQSRETAAFAMQYATNQGNMIRHRLFSKFSEAVESLYRQILLIVGENWDIPHVIKVAGEENTYEIDYVKGSDFVGGYDIKVEYGTSLSLDPVTRRQEILQLMPIFEKANMPISTLVDKLRLNDLENIYDVKRLGKSRMQEVFEKIKRTQQQVEIEPMQDHAAMLEWAYHYVMTSSYQKLPELIKQLIVQQIEQREALVAERAAQSAAQAAPGPMPGLPGPEAVADDMPAPQAIPIG